MELWIRDLTRSKLIKPNFIYYIVSDDHTTIYGETSDRSTMLGVYKSEEIALEIIKEIKQKIINLQLLEAEHKGKAKNDINKYSYLECVYDMPEV